MKPLFCLSFVLLATIANAKNYYVSATGNDANDGLTAAKAWQTVTKVNSSQTSLVAGDSILFKSGNSFYGTLTISKSGTASKSIVFGAYGTGAKPVITGFVNATGWISAGPNLWQSSAINGTNAPNMVTINTKVAAIGRYPNSGYLTFESSVGNTSITDNQLTDTPNWTGAEICVRKEHWILSRDLITSHTGSTISYTGISGYNSRNGYGYFVQNSLATLDTLNEWFFNKTTRKITVYSPSPPANVKVSARDTILYIGTSDYITVNGIAFEGGNVATAFVGSSLGQAVNDIIQNCDFNFSGRDAVYGTNNNNCVVNNCNINNSLNNAINWVTQGGRSLNATISNNAIKNSGMIAGMGYMNTLKSYNASYSGIMINGENSLIQYNTVDSTGYNPINYYYDNSQVKYNKVNYYCVVKDDGAGIYTWTGYDGVTQYKGRKVIGNIVMNGIGAGPGTSNGIGAAQGIYLDDGTTGVLVDSNTVYNTAYGGIYIHNTRWATVTNNLVYACKVTQLLIVHDKASPNSPIRNLILQNNKFVGDTSLAPVVKIISARNDIDSFSLTPGAINNNYYCRPSNENFTINVTRTVNGVNVVNDYTLDSWNTAHPAYDGSSNVSSLIFSNYQLNSLLTANLVANGPFNTNISGIGMFSQTGNVTLTWDNTSKITGAGSLKISPAQSKLDFTTINGNGAGLGAISAAKKYILRVTTLGSGNGVLKAYLRKNTSPYTALSAKQTAPFGRTKKVHEFLFTAPTSDAAATFVFEIQESTGITYLDDISFYEANATVIDNSDKVRFEYNPTNSPKTIVSNGEYINVDSTVYSSFITLQPFGSAVLLKSAAPILFKANAGSDMILFLPINSTVLNGSGTGTIASYSWTKISGPAQYNLAAPNKASTAISNLVMGIYTFQLKVKNSAGDSALSVINVTTTGVLPVVVVDFSAKNNNNKIALAWQVTSETNVSHYSIERSNNGQDFEKIGQLNSNNHIDVNSSYNFIDDSPLQGVNYYKLVIIDKGGTKNYGKTISVTVRNAPAFVLNNLSVYGAGKNIRIGVNSNYRQLMNLAVIDVNGRILYTKAVQLEKGFNTIDQQIGLLSTGIYYAKLMIGGESITRVVLSGW